MSIRRDAMAYSNALPFFAEIKHYLYRLTAGQITDLKKQALSGDVDGAIRRLHQVLREAEDDA